MDWKKILKLTVGLVIIGAIVATTYYLLKNDSAAENIIELVFPTSENNGNGDEEATTEKLRLLVNSETFDYWVSKTQGLFYMIPTGEIYRRNFEGEDELLSAQQVPRVRRISPSPDGNSIIAEFNHPFSTTFAIFNVSTRNWKVLPNRTIAATWSPNGQEIALADGTALKILDLKTDKTREISKFSQQDVELSWLVAQKLLISQSPSFTQPSSLWSLDLTNRNFLPLIESANGLMIKWSDDRTLGIRLDSIDGKPYTRLMNSNGETIATFSFKTMPSKCLINADQIYCAVPENIRDGVKLPDDYLKRAAYFNDRIYLIDMSDGGIEVLFEDLTMNIDADHLEFLDDSIAFRNRIDGKIYSLTLP